MKTEVQGERHHTLQGSPYSFGPQSLGTVPEYLGPDLQDLCFSGMLTWQHSDGCLNSSISAYANGAIAAGRTELPGEDDDERGVTWQCKENRLSVIFRTAAV